ncbi:nuclear transport factor 2 family protein [Stenotrophomonas ginsengisoli]|uniref:nuclear transport factor 2 family protein n=1 Tax=Stenotrophomonas ginsengisoli TaxID=336566 RepID=UPI0009FA8AC3|nr:nuclear transport factor 2 family protein [Stenotrophomonas ginsengisoli]
MRTALLRIVATLLPALALPASASSAGPAPLETVMATLDQAVFDSFNRCADPAQLALHAAHFDPQVEFYHDTGGVTQDRRAMLDNTARHACGRYTRQLVPGTLQVHAVKDFGAITQGQHRFCDMEGQHCDGLAEFVMVWQQRGSQWQITRVLSYGHRPNLPAAADKPPAGCDHPSHLPVAATES